MVENRGEYYRSYIGISILCFWIIYWDSHIMFEWSGLEAWIHTLNMDMPRNRLRIQQILQE